MTVHEGALLCGRYRLEKLIGDGGTADVYRAFDEERQAPVAIKVLHPHLAADPDFVHRFRSEAAALEALDHPSIVRLYAFEETGAEVFLVLDYVAGATLRDRLVVRRAPFDLREASGILHDLSGALHYAHRKGIVHQDLKPGNIMLKSDGRAVLTDFGIARAFGSAGATNATMGTPAYMSPEQIRGDPADAQTDIYSLGVVLYEMVAGRRPFTGAEVGLSEANTTDRLHEAHLWLSPTDPRNYNPKLPAEASAVILRALAKRSHDRWPDVLSLRLAWDAALGAGITAHDDAGVPLPPLGQPAKQRGGGWAWLLGLGLMVALAAVGFMVFTLLRGSALIASAPPLAPTPVSMESPTVTRLPDTPTLTPVKGSGGVMIAVMPTIPPASPSAPHPTVSETTAPATAAPTVQAKEPTLIPTHTSEPSVTPIPAATIAPARPPASTATRTARPAASSGGVTLLAPAAGEQLQGRVTFEWRNAGGFALRPGEQYELIFWQPGEDGLRNGRSPVGASDRPAATVEMAVVEQALGLPSGQLMWGVRLWGPSGAVRMLSDARPFNYAQSSEGGGGSAPPKPDQ